MDTSGGGQAGPRGPPVTTHAHRPETQRDALGQGWTPSRGLERGPAPLHSAPPRPRSQPGWAPRQGPGTKAPLKRVQTWGGPGSPRGAGWGCETTQVRTLSRRRQQADPERVRGKEGSPQPDRLCEETVGPSEPGQGTAESGQGPAQLLPPSRQAQGAGGHQLRACTAPAVGAERGAPTGPGRAPQLLAPQVGKGYVCVASVGSGHRTGQGLRRPEVLGAVGTGKQGDSLAGGRGGGGDEEEAWPSGQRGEPALPTEAWVQGPPGLRPRRGARSAGAVALAREPACAPRPLTSPAAAGLLYPLFHGLSLLCSIVTMTVLTVCVLERALASGSGGPHGERAEPPAVCPGKKGGPTGGTWQGATTGGGEQGLALSTGHRACTRALPAPRPSPTCPVGPTTISSFRCGEAKDTAQVTRPRAARLLVWRVLRTRHGVPDPCTPGVFSVGPGKS